MKRRNGNLGLIGLVLILGVQLTGLTCLGESQVISATALVEAMDLSPSPEGAVTDDGCPCHFVFQTISLFPFSVVSPFTSILPESPTLFVSTFIHFLFHPPVLA